MILWLCTYIFENKNTQIVIKWHLILGNWPGQRRLPRSETLWTLCTRGWLLQRQWQWPPGTVEQRWPGGGELPEGCGPGCWTDNPHRSCMGSGCHKKRPKLTKLNEHIFKTKAVHRGVWSNKHRRRGDGYELHLDLFHQKQTAISQ